MNFTGKDGLFDEESAQEVISQKVKEVTGLSKRLIDDAGKIIDTVLSSEEDRTNLRMILLLRHPNTGQEPQAHEISQFLCDLPAYILTVHSQYLYAKRMKEKYLAELRPKAERLLAEEKIEMKKNGTPLSLFGQITKDDIRDKLHSLSEFKELLRWEEEETQLDMIVKLLGYRRYELSSILEIQLKGI